VQNENKSRIKHEKYQFDFLLKNAWNDLWCLLVG